MRKVVAAINMSLDGNCDHTVGIADDELHEHYSGLLAGSGVALYGRITYQLMEFWPTLLKNSSGNKTLDEFAVIMDRIPKVVFSNTLQTLSWASARLAKKSLREEVAELKQQEGKDIIVGSRSLIIALLNAGLIDELQLCIHPVIAGSGLQLFDEITGKIELRLTATKALGSGAIVLYYEPVKQTSS